MSPPHCHLQVGWSPSLCCQLSRDRAHCLFFQEILVQWDLLRSYHFSESISVCLATVCGTIGGWGGADCLSVAKIQEGIGKIPTAAGSRPGSFDVSQAFAIFFLTECEWRDSFSEGPSAGRRVGEHPEAEPHYSGRASEAPPHSSQPQFPPCGSMWLPTRHSC